MTINSSSHNTTKDNLHIIMKFSTLIGVRVAAFSTLVCGAGVYLYLFRCCIAVRFSTLVCGAGVYLYLFRCCML